MGAAVPGSGEALAAPPTAQDFQIYYFLTDRFGDRNRQMSQQDMELIVNQARCECDQKIAARVTFQGGAVDQDQTNVYVGQNCATAQSNGGLGQFAPCAQLGSGTPQAFQTGQEYTFSPIFLAWGVTGSQAITEAVADGQCSGIEGESGIWMCSGVNTCSSGTFFMDGTTNFNSPGMGIRYDYQPPVNPPTNFVTSAGDRSVGITWDITATPGAGYRVLCADADGNPVPNAFADAIANRDELSIMDRTLYYTKNNLCPDGDAFGPDYGGEGGTGTGDGDGDAGTGTETGTGDGDGDLACTPGTELCECELDLCDEGLSCDPDLSLCVSDSCADNPGLDDCPCDAEGSCADDALECNEQGICEFLGCTPGEPGCVCAEGDTCTSPSTCVNGFCNVPTTGIESLDWAYVCSEHLGNVTREARIEGLENGQEYTFIVVAYDNAGNAVASETLTATPVETRGLWEECEAQGNICGQGWSCSVSGEQPDGRGWVFSALGLLGLGLGALARRRRRA